METETLLRQIKVLFSDPLQFTSLGFVVFFTLVFLIQAGFSFRQEVRLGVLLTAGLLFFYHFSGEYLLIIVAVALSDYALALAMSVSKKEIIRRLAVLLSVGINVGILVYFKYTGFFYEWWQKIVTPNAPFETWQWLAPVGLSYFTFKSLSYTLDVYYENIEKPERNFLYYLFYVTFFPSILAGPITRASEFLPQIRRPYLLDRSTTGFATWLFLTGWVKKVVFADFMGDHLVYRVFDAPTNFTGFEVLAASFAFGVMLYFDFSGYSDMARGLGLALGFEVGQNFKEPFKALNISDFWRRWHLSLSTWFNDYVFMPLSFSLRTMKKTGVIIGVMVTFFLSGFWHGAGWTFMLWGIFHGTAIAYEQISLPFRLKIKRMLPDILYLIVSRLLTLTFLTFTFLIFRAKDLSSAQLMFEKIINEFSSELIPQWVASYQNVVWMTFAGLLLCFLPTTWKSLLVKSYLRLHWTFQAVAAALIWIIAYQVKSASVQPFVYLQF